MGQALHTAPARRKPALASLSPAAARGHTDVFCKVFRSTQGSHPLSTCGDPKSTPTSHPFPPEHGMGLHSGSGF